MLIQITDNLWVDLLELVAVMPNDSIMGGLLYKFRNSNEVFELREDEAIEFKKKLKEYYA